MKQNSPRNSNSGSPLIPRPSTAYLFLYNLIQAVGWTAIAVLAVMHYSAHDTYVGLYTDVKKLLNIFQTLAFLEVVHAAVGLVRTGTFFTLIQYLSRVFLIWGVVYMVPEAQDQIGFLFIVIAWCITEIVRYSFYMGTLASFVPFPLVFARYTLFIVLYPLGVLGELTCIYKALPHVKARGILSIALPNTANMSFNYYSVLIFIGLIYIPFFPQLYLHMFAQRKKALGEKAVKVD